MMLFCAYMAFVYVPWDFFAKPAAHDAEVWFGIMLTGGWAKLTEPLHWLVYAAGAYGFRRMRGWMWPWASLYTVQIALGMWVWSGIYASSGAVSGWILGLIPGLLFLVPSVALWRARPLFQERPTLRQRYAGWALVTGASAGLGAEFARQLARDGVPCVLTARREDRLRDLAEELERDHGVETRVVAADLAQPDGADTVANAVADLDVAILVNNAGFGYQGRFDKQETARLRDMVTLNCATPVVLTSRLMGRMKERGSGAVVITGSVSGRQPLPLHAVYGATKAFDQLFGEALANELRADGIDVLVLEPGSTQSEFQHVSGALPHHGVPADPVVADALDALGWQASVISGWWNWIRANTAMRLLPRGVAAHLGRSIMASQTPEDMR
ncbi:MAG: SDR family NAD(P)-dependent oxidoreductase [Myxococcales bacterium]|nr:SDR family NAD(P)-dependent oxidoreductase [Myxococcales bacterium]